MDKLVGDLRGVFDAADHINTEEVRAILDVYKSNSNDWSQYSHFDKHKYTRNLVDVGNGKYNLMILCWGPSMGSSIHDHTDSHCFVKILQGEMLETQYAWPKGLGPERNAGEDSCTRRDSQNTQDQNDMENVRNSKNVNSNAESAPESRNERANETVSRQVLKKKDTLVEDESQPMKPIIRNIYPLNAVSYISDQIGLHRMENPSHSEPAVTLHLYIPPYSYCNVFDERTGKRTKANVTFYTKFGEKIDYTQRP